MAEIIAGPCGHPHRQQATTDPPASTRQPVRDVFGEGPRPARDSIGDAHARSQAQQEHDCGWGHLRCREAGHGARVSTLVNRRRSPRHMIRVTDGTGSRFKSRLVRPRRRLGRNSLQRAAGLTVGKVRLTAARRLWGVVGGEPPGRRAREIHGARRLARLHPDQIEGGDLFCQVGGKAVHRHFGKTRPSATRVSPRESRAPRTRGGPNHNGAFRRTDVEVSYAKARVVASAGLEPLSNREERNMPLAKRALAELVGTSRLVFGGCGSAVLAAGSSHS